MELCSRCVLPATFPGIRFDGNGVCDHCLKFERRTGSDVEKERNRRRFQEIVESISDRPGFHCALALSGGKESSYTLSLLREHYGLRVLAVTFDNGFISPQAEKSFTTPLTGAPSQGPILPGYRKSR